MCASGGKKGKCENLQGWGLGAGGGAQVGDVKGGEGMGTGVRRGQARAGEAVEVDGVRS